MRIQLPILTYAALALAACGADLDTLDIDTESSNLSTTPLIDSSCTAAQAARIAPALTKLGAFLADSGPTGALATLSDHYSLGPRRSPEYTIAQLRSTGPTVVSCIPAPTCYGQTESCGTMSGTTENLSLWVGILDGSAAHGTAFIAGALALALGDAHGFGGANSPGYNPGQILKAQLAQAGGSSAVKRSTLPGETELAILGEGTGNTPFTMSCPNAKEMPRGLRVGTSFAQVWSLQLLCDSSTSSVVGTSSILAIKRDLRCAGGEVMVGVTGDDSPTFGRVGIKCRPQADVVAGTASVTHDQEYIGTGTPSYARLCPATMAVERISGYVGLYPSSMRVACHNPNTGKRGAFTSAPLLGATSGATIQRSECPGYGALSSIEARYTATGIRPIELLVECVSTAAKVGQIPAATWSFPYFDEVQTHTFDWAPTGDCDLNSEATVGIMGVNDDGILVGFQLLCADRGGWYGTGTVAMRTTPALLPYVHVSTQAPTSSVCPRGTEIAGFDQYSSGGASLVGLAPRCRSLAAQ